MLTRRLPGGDEGALAVMVALLAIVLFGLAALAVDLGNAFTRNRDVQYQADFAALAGAADTGLPAPADTPSASHPAVVQAANYLFRNQPQNDNGAFPLTAAELAVDLADGDPANGEAYYGHFGPSGALVPSRYELTVRTPPALIKYGFAAVFGTSQDSVNSYATVGLQSPGGSGMMPFFAVSGCDYGPQILTDPANGQVQTAVPNMAFPTDKNRAELRTASPTQFDVSTSSSRPTITITGKPGTIGQVTKIGFFRNLTETPTASPQYIETPSFAASGSTGGTINPVNVPVGVTSVAGVWWVRAWGPKTPAAGSTLAWSARAEALPIRIGDAVIQCPGGSSAGNFGSLKLPRSGPPSNWLAKNIAEGLELPLSLAVFPGDPPPTNCPAGTFGRVYSTAGSLMPGTNCVDTDTGLTANATTAGMVTNSPARLTAKPTSVAGGNGCSPARTDAERPLTIQSTTYSINDDTLSCFLLPGFKVSDIWSSSYTLSGPALRPEIYSSPRFFWVPIVGTTPVPGGSQWWSIVGFRAAFLTSDDANSTESGRSFYDGNSTATGNGLTVAHNGITSMRVVFFNEKALPNDAGGAPTTAFIGTGPRVLVMTN